MDKLNEGFLDSITMPLSLSKYAFSMGFGPEKIANSSVDKLVGFVAVPWLKANKKYVPTLRKLGNDDLEAGLTKVVALMQKNFSERVHKNDLSDSEKEFLGESRIREADDDDLLGYGEETDEPITDVYDGELTGRPIGKTRLHPSEIDYAADSRELEGWDALDDPDAYAKDYPIAWKNEQAAAGPTLAEKEWEELIAKSNDTDIRNGAGGFLMAGNWDEGNADDGKDFYDVGLKESALFESILKGRK